MNISLFLLSWDRKAIMYRLAARLIGYENDNEERNEVAMKVVIKTAMKAVMKI